MSFISNAVVLHARDGFEDYDDPDERRHLRRLWLASPKITNRSPVMQALYDSGFASWKKDDA